MTSWKIQDWHGMNTITTQIDLHDLHGINKVHGVNANVHNLQFEHIINIIVQCDELYNVKLAFIC